jgi:hypothetical protein
MNRGKNSMGRTTPWLTLPLGVMVALLLMAILVMVVTEASTPMTTMVVNTITWNVNSVARRDILS